jgi:hypothetical protein
MVLPVAEGIVTIDGVVDGVLVPRPAMCVSHFYETHVSALGHLVCGHGHPRRGQLAWAECV